MLEQLVNALVGSANEAADEVLLEALARGNEREKAVALGGLLRRESVRGLGGVIASFEQLPQSLQRRVLEQIKVFHTALRECGRSDDRGLRVRAMKLIALSRQGRLSFVLSENLNHADEALSRPAVEALVALARWVAQETQSLSGLNDEARQLAHERVLEQRPEIEATIARALDMHRGRHAQELLRAALVLCDWAGSKTLGILHTAKHGGQSPMVRRLQQPPAAEHVPAFLLGASHGGLRTHFGIAFSHIDEAPVLDGLLRQTHWLKDHQLQLCMRQVARGTWWGDTELRHDIERRTAGEAAKIGEWLAASSTHDAVQDERLLTLLQHARGDFSARLRILRIALARPRGASLQVLRAFLNDADERLVRLAARDLVRRKPADLQALLLQLMTSVQDSVRRVIARSLGQEGFEHFWQRFDRLERSTRKAAGKAMLKMLPDAVSRLGRRLMSGPVGQRIKAMQITHELELAEALRPALLQLCSDAHPRIRSKAVSILGELATTPAELLLDKVLEDSDARVRANAVEVLEHHQRTDYLPLLAQRGRSGSNRERANAIKALHRMKVGVFSQQLHLMLRDERPEHRISAMWVLRHIGWWQLLPDVGQMAKTDGNLKVRRYALNVLRGVAEMAAKQKGKAV